jgi:glycosyltransferase involved in cell wall biosynthesis
LKVLWISHNPLPLFADVLGVKRAISGGWLVALSEALVNSGKVCLGVVSDVACAKWTHKRLGGVENYSIPVARRRRPLLCPSKAMILYYKQVVKDFNPDLIHIQGTEAFYGLMSAEGVLGRPTIISIQGIVDYCRHYLLGGLSTSDVFRTRTLRDWILFDGLFENRMQWNRRAAMERRIFSGNSTYIGRTLWDRAHLRRLNPNASYYECHEIVRDEFFDTKWNLADMHRHTIFAPSASYPLKGFHILLKAVAILKREFPDVRVRVPLGHFTKDTWYTSLRQGGYANYLMKLVKQLNLNENIIALGVLSAQEMATEMCRSHVFALSSFVENSPNSMAEAFSVGVPSVVSLTGGIPGLIIEGQDALGFPLGDESVLAEQIRRIFIDESLAVRLSQNAKKTSIRYSPEKIVDRMIEIYKSVSKKS